MKLINKPLHAGIVFFLIPIVQRLLDVAIRSIRLLMDNIDGLAFSLARKLPVDD